MENHIFTLITKSFGLLKILNLLLNKMAKLISTFGFSTIYIKLIHKDLVQVLLGLTDFGFNGDSKKNQVFH